jgi:hypothetical protein
MTGRCSFPTLKDLSIRSLARQPEQNFSLLPSNLFHAVLERAESEHFFLSKREVGKRYFCFRNFFSSIQQLEEIRLRTDSGFSSSAVFWLSKRYQSLKEIDLKGCKDIEDTTIIAVAKNCRQLASIVLWDCSAKITHKSANALAKYCKHLSLLKISFPENDMLCSALFYKTHFLEGLEIAQKNVKHQDIKHLLLNNKQLSYLKIWTQTPLKSKCIAVLKKHGKSLKQITILSPYLELQRMQDILGVSAKYQFPLRFCEKSIQETPSLFSACLSPEGLAMILESYKHRGDFLNTLFHFLINVGKEETPHLLQLFQSSLSAWDFKHFGQNFQFLWIDSFSYRNFISIFQFIKNEFSNENYEAFRKGRREADKTIFDSLSVLAFKFAPYALQKALIEILSPLDIKIYGLLIMEYYFSASAEKIADALISLTHIGLKIFLQECLLNSMDSEAAEATFDAARVAYKKIKALSESQNNFEKMRLLKKFYMLKRTAF